MTLKAFQQALCDLIASPNLCLVMRAAPDQVLDRYELSPRERRRLVSVVWQRGMSTNCSLYRVNRITPVYTLLPSTCFLLGDALIREVERFWDSYECIDLQFKHEIDRFGAFLKRRIGAGEIDNPLLEEVLDLELSANTLRFMPHRQIARELRCTATVAPDMPLRLHPLVKVVRFQHDPIQLLPLLADRRPPPYELTEGEFFILLRAIDEELAIEPIEPRLAHLLLAVEVGAMPLLGPNDAAILIKAGLVIR